MKKLNRILLVLSLALCLVGGVLLAVGAFAGGIDDAQEIAGTRTRTYSQEKTQLEDFTTIDADLALLDLEIRPSGDDHAYLEYHIDAPLDRQPLEAAVHNQVLTLRDWREDESNNVTPPVSNLLSWLPYGEQRSINNSEAILYLPATTFARCTIDMDLGELTIDGLNANALNLSLSVGDLTLKNCTFASSDIDLDLGNANGDNISMTGDNSVSLSTGDLSFKLTNPDALNINADTDIGNVNTNDRYNGNLSDSHFSQTPDNAAGSLTLSADLGDITLE